MLRYPSTKQILTVAVLSALLAGCGKDSKKANPGDQVAVKREDRVRLVQMKSEEKYIKPKKKERT